MRHIFILLAFLLSLNAFAGDDDTTSSPEKNLKDKIINDIRISLDTKNKSIDSTILKLNTRVVALDSALKKSGSDKERIDKLVERVKLLEEKRDAEEENELNTYQANYQTAIINLVSMDREIKPLILFHTTKDFFNTLTETSNPTTYEGFNASFNDFKVYVEAHKGDNAGLKTVADIVQATGNISFGIPLVGAYSQLLFTSMADYINSIGHKKREMMASAEKMFAITTALSQFNTDKGIVEGEWDEITGSLDEMQDYYDSVLVKNLRMLDADEDDFSDSFSKQTDANVRYKYMTTLREKASDYVTKMKKNYPKDWKENIYYQLVDVQSLKLKYGEITLHIRKHIDKYDKLIAKYKSNKDIGTHVSNLDNKLTQLKETFDSAFDPQEYVRTASRMYKVL